MSKTNIYKPQYRVLRNTNGVAYWSHAVMLEGSNTLVPIFKNELGARPLYYYMIDGKHQSQLFPTLRDCVVNIVYGM